jgi:hypothetical protein
MPESKQDLPRNNNVKKIQAKTKKTVFTDTKRVVNEETGQVKQTVTNTIAVTSQEPLYVKVYLQDINRIYDLPKGCSPALYEILKEMNWKGLISLPKYIKDQCAAAAGLTPASFNNCISDLVKHDILKRIGQTVYIANANLFGQGKWIEIIEKRETYNLTVNYTKGGKREVTSSFDPENPENQHDKGQNNDDLQESA